MVRATEFLPDGLWSTPGGLGSTYDAQDGDPYLTKIALTVAPLIRAIEDFRQRHGHYPDFSVQVDVLELEREVPVKIEYEGRWIKVPGLHPTRADYTVARDEDAFSLSVKLGWDPRLYYVRDHQGSRWVFGPGDGSEDREIVLDW